MLNMTISEYAVKVMIPGAIIGAVSNIGMRMLGVPMPVRLAVCAGLGYGYGWLFDNGYLR